MPYLQFMDEAKEPVHRTDPEKKKKKDKKGMQTIFSTVDQAKLFLHENKQVWD